MPSITNQEYFNRITSRNKRSRNASVSAFLSEYIPLQIRALRKKMKWTQGDLAKECGKHQSQISDWENPEVGGWTVHTLLDLAEAFDVALAVKFIPFSEFAEGHDKILNSNLAVLNCEEELKELARRRRKAKKQIAESQKPQENATDYNPSLRPTGGGLALSPTLSEAQNGGKGSVRFHGLRNDSVSLTASPRGNKVDV